MLNGITKGSLTSLLNFLCLEQLGPCLHRRLYAKPKINQNWGDKIFDKFLISAQKHLLQMAFSWKQVLSTRVLQKVLSLGSDYFSAMFYQTYFYYKPSKYSSFTETNFCNLFTQS